ncbi:DUF6776 family protein [Caldimonas tepidiphila]|uniref:DUF6776 family protein n=1 Tax=Caldimonas tepidiphila TaxID=2315841 RepID=UPI000E5A2934|nr:DUF6776 family protein [Caldimonas tepidiphila]
MRWKLLRRRLSISAPRMIVRRQLPWPLRWAALALMLGFSAALALWAFEFGRGIAGLDRGARAQLAELEQLRATVAELRAERERAQSIANTADSLLKAERVAQERLAAQVRELEGQNQSLRSDLAFFEQLMPAGAAGGGALAVRQIEARVVAPGQLQYRLLMMQSGRAPAEFSGRYELSLAGQLDGKPWSFAMPGGAQLLQVKQYRRVEGTFEYPSRAVVKSVQVRVTDPAGAVRATQTQRL